MLNLGHLFRLFCFFKGESLLFPPLPEPSEVPTLLLPTFFNLFASIFFPEEDADDSASAFSLLLKFSFRANRK